MEEGYGLSPRLRNKSIASDIKQSSFVVPSFRFFDSRSAISFERRYIYTVLHDERTDWLAQAVHEISHRKDLTAPPRLALPPRRTSLLEARGIQGHAKREIQVGRFESLCARARAAKERGSDNEIYCARVLEFPGE